MTANNAAKPIRSWDRHPSGHDRVTDEVIERHDAAQWVANRLTESIAAKDDFAQHIESDKEYSGRTPVMNQVELIAKRAGVVALKVAHAVLG